MYSPTVVDVGNLAVRSVALGEKHTCITFQDNMNVVKCFGDHSNGALGLGDQFNATTLLKLTPKELPFVDLGASNNAVIVQIALSSLSTFVLLEDDFIITFPPCSCDNPS